MISAEKQGEEDREGPNISTLSSLLLVAVLVTNPLLTQSIAFELYRISRFSMRRILQIILFRPASLFPSIPSYSLSIFNVPSLLPHPREDSVRIFGPSLSRTSFTLFLCAYHPCVQPSPCLIPLLGLMVPNIFPLLLPVPFTWPYFFIFVFQLFHPLLPL